MNLDLFCIDNARVIYRKIRHLLYNVDRFPQKHIASHSSTEHYYLQKRKVIPLQARRGPEGG